MAVSLFACLHTLTVARVRKAFAPRPCEALAFYFPHLVITARCSALRAFCRICLLFLRDATLCYTAPASVLCCSVRPILGDPPHTQQLSVSLRLVVQVLLHSPGCASFSFRHCFARGPASTTPHALSLRHALPDLCTCISLASSVACSEIPGFAIPVL